MARSGNALMPTEPCCLSNKASVSLRDVIRSDFLKENILFQAVLCCQKGGGCFVEQAKPGVIFFALLRNRLSRWPLTVPFLARL